MDQKQIAAIVLALLAFPALASAQEVEEPAVEEESEEYEEEFCGGDEPSMVDVASGELESGEPESARDILVEALRQGGIESWERPRALIVLAEAQLRLGETRHAIFNYRKGLRLDPGAGAEARVGLATALYLHGIAREAHDVAVTARSELCVQEWAAVACFGATSIVARTGLDPSERAQANEEIGELRVIHSDLHPSFDEVEARLSARARS